MAESRTEIPYSDLPSAHQYDPDPRKEFELFAQAVDLDAAARAAFLDRACADNLQLREAIEQLLEASDRAAGNPAWDLPALHHEAAASADGLTVSGLDRYEILDRIGAGGMGVVYRATRKDRQFTKLVALKIAHSSQPDLLERFYRERQIVAGLEHPNIARLLDVGTTDDGAPFLVMEFVDGVAIDRYLAERRPNTRGRLILFRKICSAVSHAHRNLVVHRDLKPANILVTPEGEPKLLDFGVAKLLDATAPHTLAGAAMTPEYASPEQIAGGTITTASDIYSAGVLLYRMLSGRLPYRQTDSPAGLAHAITVEPPEPISGIDADLANIIQMALRKEPARRYATIDQFSEDILRYLDGYPVSARPDTRMYRLAKFAGRNRALLTGAVTVALALIAGIITARSAQHRAERRFDQLRKLSHAVVFDYHDSIETLPGSTPVRRRMVKDALEYLDSLTAEAPEPALQRELIDSYVRISQDQGNSYYVNLGETAAALVSARKAAAVGENLLRKDSSPATRQSLAAAIANEGDLEYATEHLEAAAARYRRAVELGESVARNEPGNAGNLAELATTLRHWGDLCGGGGFANLGRTADARQLYQRARDVADQLVRLHPDEWSAQKARYSAQIKLAALDLTTGLLADGERETRDALFMIEKIAASNPANTHDQVELANVSAKLGLISIDNAKPSDAIPRMKRAVDILDQLQRKDPQAALFRHFLALNKIRMAEALRSNGQPAEALPHDLAALSLAEALAAGAPDEVEFRVDAAMAHRDLAETMLATRSTRQAIEHGEKSVAILAAIRGTRRDAFLPAESGLSLRVLGNAQLHANRLTAALASYSRSVAELEAPAAHDPANTSLQSDLARSLDAEGDCLAKTGDHQAATKAYSKADTIWTALRKRHALTAIDSARR